MSISLGARFKIYSSVFQIDSSARRGDVIPKSRQHSSQFTQFDLTG